MLGSENKTFWMCNPNFSQRTWHCINMLIAELYYMWNVLCEVI